jgi:hypothetical protein
MKYFAKVAIIALILFSVTPSSNLAGRCELDYGFIGFTPDISMCSIQVADDSPGEVRAASVYGRTSSFGLNGSNFNDLNGVWGNRQYHTPAHVQRVSAASKCSDAGANDKSPGETACDGGTRPSVPVPSSLIVLGVALVAARVILNKIGMRKA